MWWNDSCGASSCVFSFLYKYIIRYTLGRGGDESNILFDQSDSSRKLFKIERGGEVTHHAPGQLTAYPILNLNYYIKDLHAYLRLVYYKTFFYFIVGRINYWQSWWIWY